MGGRGISSWAASLPVPVALHEQPTSGINSVGLKPTIIGKAIEITKPPNELGWATLLLSYCSWWLLEVVSSLFRDFFLIARRHSLNSFHNVLSSFCKNVSATIVDITEKYTMRFTIYIEECLECLNDICSALKFVWNDEPVSKNRNNNYYPPKGKAISILIKRNYISDYNFQTTRVITTQKYKIIDI